MTDEGSKGSKENQSDLVGKASWEALTVSQALNVDHHRYQFRRKYRPRCQAAPRRIVRHIFQTLLSKNDTSRDRLLGDVLGRSIEKRKIVSFRERRLEEVRLDDLLMIPACCMSAADQKMNRKVADRGTGLGNANRVPLTMR